MSVSVNWGLSSQFTIILKLNFGSDKSVKINTIAKRWLYETIFAMNFGIQSSLKTSSHETCILQMSYVFK